MKKTTLLYWIFTGLLAAGMTASSIPNVLSDPEAVAFFKHLGYPAYLLPFLGVAKLLGVLAILVPGFPRLREWAYAGFTFDLAGAIYSGLSVGDPLIQWTPVMVGFLLIAGSCYLSRQRAEAATVDVGQPVLA